MTDSEKNIRRIFYYTAADQYRPTERLARLVADMHEAEVVKLQRQSSFPVDWLQRYVKPDGPGSGGSAPHQTDVCGLVAGWPETAEEAQEIMATAKQLRATAYILRQYNADRIGRVVVATAGGIHSVRVLALADMLSREFNLPLETINAESGGEPEDSRGIGNILPRSLGKGRGLKGERTAAIVAEIDAQAGPDDLLLIGAPHFGVAASHFEGSLPDQLARVRRGPLLMCLSEIPPSPSFKEFLWEANVCIGVDLDSRDKVIHLLVQRLCESGVVPAHLYSLCLKMALTRESLSTTVVGRHTALPHARLPDYDGVAAALAICPDGIVFDKGHEATRFVFLLISSPSSHERYLGMLSRIARQMPDVKLRESLLTAGTAREVMVALGG